MYWGQGHSAVAKQANAAASSSETQSLQPAMAHRGSPSNMLSASLATELAAQCTAIFFLRAEDWGQTLSLSRECFLINLCPSHFGISLFLLLLLLWSA